MKLYTRDGRLTDHELNVLADYGPLVVTAGLPKDQAAFNVTHKATTSKVRGFGSLSKANIAAESWADFPFWDLIDFKTPQTQLDEIKATLKATPEWEGGID